MSNVVTKAELVIELEKKLHYHMNGGTTYRIKTTQLSVQVVNRTSDINCFYDKQHSYDTVANALPDQDEYRLQDVSKMISIIVRDLELKKSLPTDVKAYADEKMKSFKSLKFK